MSRWSRREGDLAMVAVGTSTRRAVKSAVTGAMMSAASVDHYHPFPRRSTADYAAFGARGMGCMTRHGRFRHGHRAHPVGALRST